jgi:hypothetical protein
MAEAAVSNTVQCGFESHPGHAYDAVTMAGWLVERRLSQNVARLKTLRSELAQIDEQLDVVASDADDSAIRAMVSETPGAAFEANDARKHAAAMARHRQHVVDTIRELERKQDELLDKLTSGSR